MRKLSTNAFLVFTGDIGARILGFVASAHLARSLGREGFGIIVIGLSYLSYVFWFADLGLGTLGSREMGKAPERREHSLGEILSTRVLLSAFVILPALGLAAILYRHEPVRGVIFAYILSSIPYGLLLEWYYQGTRRYRPIAISRSLNAAVYLAGVYLVVHDRTDVTLVPYLYFASSLAPALFLLAVKRDGESLLPSRFSLRSSLAILKKSSMIGIGGIFAQTVQLLPPLLLGYYSMGDTGLLGAALRIIAVVLVVDRVFSMLFLPAIAKLWSEQRQRAVENLERVLAIVIILGFALGTLLTINAGVIMPLVFSAAYRDGALVLALLSWFATITLINSVFSFGLIGIGKERGYLRATVIGGVVTAIICGVMIDLLRLEGAALAMVISEICITALAYRELRRSVTLRFGRPLAVALVISTATIVAAAWLGFGESWRELIWQGPLVAIVFLGLSLLFGGLKKDDIVWVMRR